MSDESRSVVATEVLLSEGSPVKLRSALLLMPAVAGLSLGTLAPAQAAASDPVTDLTVSVVQAPGTNDSWRVSAQWTANPDATSYSVVIADHADGTVTSGKAYGNKDTSATNAALTSDNLVADQDYWLAVQPIAPESGAVAVAQFHTPGLDTTAPTGTYKLSATTVFLTGGAPFEETGGIATVAIAQTAVDSGTVTRTVLPGDGSAAKAWTTTKPFPLQYAKAGTFTPKVRLTDEFGNSRDVTLPRVWVRVDNIAPLVKIARPAAPTKAASWKVVRGTASDVGTGIEMVASFVIQKRGGVWWAYDFGKRKWLKGYTSMKKTLNKSKARAAFMEPAPSGAWRTPTIKRLTKGALHVEAIAIDQNFNVGRMAKLNQKIR